MRNEFDKLAEVVDDVAADLNGNPVDLKKRNEFLSKDPEKALMQVKETLYGRLEVLRTCISGAGKDEYGYIDDYDRAMGNEMDFIQGLLDQIERW
jgi:hypothetical protein